MKILNGYVIDCVPKDLTTELGGQGEYRAVTKCRAGFPTIYDMGALFSPLSALHRVRPEALLNLQYKPKGCEYWLCLYARKGRKIVVVDKSLLK